MRIESAEIELTFSGYKNTKEIYGADIPPKEATSTKKERPSLLVNVQAKIHHRFRRKLQRFSWISRKPMTISTEIRYWNN